MPLNLPDKLPAIEILKKENIFVMDDLRSAAQDIRPLKILILLKIKFAVHLKMNIESKISSIKCSNILLKTLMNYCFETPRNFPTTT